MTNRFYWFPLCLCAVNPPCLAGQLYEERCDCIVDIKLTDCSGRDLTTVLEGIPSSTEYLDFSRNCLTVIHAGAFRSLWNLGVLLLNDNNISAVASGAFFPLANLHRLDMSRNMIFSLNEKLFLGLSSLRELLLAGNQLKHLDKGSFLHLDALQRLNLSRNALHSIHVRAFSYMTALRQLHLDGNELVSLSNGVFSMLRSLEVLNLQGNRINTTEVGVFLPLTSLSVLNLASNNLSTVHFKTFLSIHSYSTHILLADNPWHCDCDLQRVFRKLRNVQRLFLDDYANLTCDKPSELHGYKLTQVDAELCIAETVTVLLISITVVITVMASIVMAERNKGRVSGKLWSEPDYGLEEY